MREVTYYIAEDGTQFDDEIECLDYELIMTHPALHDVKVYDASGKRLYNLLADYTYNYSETVVIENEAQLKALQAVREYCGWCEWEEIDAVGTWIHTNNYNFIQKRG